MERSLKRVRLDLNWVQQYLTSNTYPSGATPDEKRIIRKRAEGFRVVDDCLMFVGDQKKHAKEEPKKVPLTEEEKRAAIESVHILEDGSHLGLDRTIKTVMKSYYWVGMYNTARHYVNNCPVCLAKKAAASVHDSRIVFVDPNPSVDDTASFTDGSCYMEEASVLDNCSDSMIQPLAPPVLYFWDKVELMLLGPFVKGKSRRHIVIFLDGFSLWTEAFVLEVISPSSIAHCIINLVCRFGVMNKLIYREVDNLKTAVLAAIDILRIEGDIDIGLESCRLENTVYFQKEIIQTVTDFVENHPTDWYNCMELCLLPLRISCAQNAEYSPVYLAYGREPNFPLHLSHRTQSFEERNLSKDDKEETITNLMKTYKLFTKEFSKASMSSEDNAGSAESNLVMSTQKPGLDGQTEKGMTTWNEEMEEDELSDAKETPRRGRPAKRKPGSPVSKVFDEKRIKTSSGSGKRKAEEEEDEADDVEHIVDGSDMMANEVSENRKDKMDMDSYYDAIWLYKSSKKYPPNSSVGFKRVMRLCAKNFDAQGEKLFYLVGKKRKLVVRRSEERWGLMKLAHIKADGTHISKKNMVERLANFFWKGMTIDSEAFVLACPSCDNWDPVSRADQSGKTKNIKDLSEDDKEEKTIDKPEVYKELHEYLSSGSFSANASDSLKVDVRNVSGKFVVEGDHLYRTSGTKRPKKLVVTSMVRRREIIENCHLVRGRHADYQNTLKRVEDDYYWFGLKVDVKVFISMCCDFGNEKLSDIRKTSRQQTLQRYFTFSDTFANQNPQMDEAVLSLLSMLEDYVSNEIPPAKEDKAELKIEESDEHNTSISDTQTLAAPTSKGTINAEEASTRLMNGIKTETQVQEDHTKDNHCMEAVKPVDGSVQDNTLIQIPAEPEASATSEEPKTPAKIDKRKLSDPVTLAAVRSILSYSEKSGMELDLDIAEAHEEEVMEEEAEDEEENEEEDEEEDGVMKSGDAIASPIKSGKDDPDYTPGSAKSSKTPRPTLRCTVCDKVVHGPIKFAMHMYKHTGQKPFQCEKCGKKFTNNKTLRIHTRKHDGYLPYLCNQCGKGFPSIGSLKSHLRTHDRGGGMPVKCEFCNRMFAHRHLLERHRLNKHINLKTEFKCSECSKIFSYQRSLKRHFLSHHMGVKNHVCDLCGKCFYRKEYLTCHMQQHRGGADVVKGRKSRYRNSTGTSVTAVKEERDSEEEEAFESDHETDSFKTRIVLQQDASGNLRVVDPAIEQEVKRMLASHMGDSLTDTMVVEIEQPGLITAGGDQTVVQYEHDASEEKIVLEMSADQKHLFQQYDDHTQTTILHIQDPGMEEQTLLHVSSDGQSYIVDPKAAGDYHRSPAVIALSSSASSGNLYAYTTSQAEISLAGQQGEVTVGQTAVQYEVECVGDVGDAEAISAINLLAQASAAQFESTPQL
ncbi:hypothetical protein CHS0354_015581 [Potamilus streckersoni]|uniref:C2H2-type domain-containing protein n=1 Tax=Potamilus streckersoni TaxID=2493646 RepID=A0AAE0RLP6_9BIVA|nr:hypothetical protein CHS0354_015581 [Potamilus streckersoni]